MDENSKLHIGTIEYVKPELITYSSVSTLNGSQASSYSKLNYGEIFF